MAPPPRRACAHAQRGGRCVENGKSVLGGADRLPRRAGDRWWYANCAWDAFGICAALHVDGRIETSCPDCGEPLAVEVRDAQPDDESLVFHCLVPARTWWDDIVFT